MKIIFATLFLMFISISTLAKQKPNRAPSSTEADSFVSCQVVVTGLGNGTGIVTIVATSKNTFKTLELFKEAYFSNPQLTQKAAAIEIAEARLAEFSKTVDGSKFCDLVIPKDSN